MAFTIISTAYSQLSPNFVKECSSIKKYSFYTDRLLYENGHQAALSALLFDSSLFPWENTIEKKVELGVLADDAYSIKTYLSSYESGTNFSSSPQGLLHIADYYLSQKKYPEAENVLSKVNPTLLSLKENQDYLLRLGYAGFMQGNNDKAKSALREALQSQDDVKRNRAAYMLGHLAYLENNTDEAKKYFQSLPQTPEYDKIVQPYFIQMAYNSGEYSEASSLAKKYLETYPDGKMKSELNKIVGESLFTQNQFSEALPYLTSYAQEIEKSGQTPSYAMLYQLGYVNAKAGQYEAAVQYYNQITSAENKFGQNAYFQLGNAYLQSSPPQKEAAMAAYKKAYEMGATDGGNPDIPKKSLRQYAKLSYDIGNPFEANEDVLLKYSENYPNDPEIKTLLAKTYLYNGDLAKSISAMEELPSMDETIKNAYREATFIKAIQSLQDGKIAEAELYLKKHQTSVAASDINQKARINFYLGEIAFEKNDYESAILQYLKVKNGDAVAIPELEDGRLDYNLGLAYLKNKQWKEADNYLNLVKVSGSQYSNEAALRLGDSQFYQGNFNEAISLYEKSSGDYAEYKIGEAFLADAEYSKAESEFTKYLNTFSAGNYTVEAIFGLAKAQTALGKYTESNATLERIKNNTQNTYPVMMAGLQTAINTQELGSTAQAVNLLNSIADNQLNSGYSTEILNAAKTIFTRQKNISGLQEFASSKGWDTDKTEIQELELAAAQQLYNEGKYTESLAQYENLEKKTSPNSESYYFVLHQLAQVHSQLKNPSSAKTYFEKVATQENPYYDAANLWLYQNAISENAIEEKAHRLQKLQNANSAQLRKYALGEQIKTSVLTRSSTGNTSLLLDKVKNIGVVAAYQDFVKVVEARTLYESGKKSAARELFKSLEKSSISAVAAEALYNKALYQAESREYKASNSTIFTIAEKFPEQGIWGASALVLLAKNYWALKDKFQTKYTLSQIIENFTEYPEIVEQARSLKNLYAL